MAAEAFRRDSSREQGGSCIPFPLLAVEVREHHFYDTLLGKTVTNVAQGPGEGTELQFLMRGMAKNLWTYFKMATLWLGGRETEVIRCG